MINLNQPCRIKSHAFFYTCVYNFNLFQTFVGNSRIHFFLQSLMYFRLNVWIYC